MKLDDAWSAFVGLSIVGVVGWLFVLPDAATFKSDSVVGYAVIATECTAKNCKITEVEPTLYRVDQTHNEVVWQKVDTKTSMDKLTQCTIVDVENWSCSNGLFRMSDGIREANYIDGLGAVRHVSRMRWRLAKLGITNKWILGL